MRDAPQKGVQHAICRSQKVLHLCVGFMLFMCVSLVLLAEPPLTEAPPLDQSAPWSAHVARSAAFSDLLAAREERAHEAAQLQREMDDAPTVCVCVCVCVRSSWHVPLSEFRFFCEYAASDARIHSLMLCMPYLMCACVCVCVLQGQMSEHESDSEEDEQSDNPTQDPHTQTTHAQGGAAQDTNGAQTSGQPPPSHKSISAAALARKRKEFLQVRSGILCRWHGVCKLVSDRKTATQCACVRVS